MVGWDSDSRLTDAETDKLLRVSHYYITAQTADGRLVGFARVWGDSYSAQVLDVMTHPDYRCKGIATGCMQRVMRYLQRSRYISVTLTDDNGYADFYQRFGFQIVDKNTSLLMWQRGSE